MKKNKGNELSIKSKLLFNNLDMRYNVLTNMSNSEDKRLKSLDVLYQTYTMTVRPFITDESKEYQDKVMSAIDAHKADVVDMVKSGMTVEGIIFKVQPILNATKEMVQTCKMNTSDMESLLKMN